MPSIARKEMTKVIVPKEQLAQAVVNVILLSHTSELYAMSHDVLQPCIKADVPSGTQYHFKPHYLRYYCQCGLFSASRDASDAHQRDLHRP